MPIQPRPPLLRLDHATRQILRHPQRVDVMLHRVFQHALLLQDHRSLLFVVCDALRVAVPGPPLRPPVSAVCTTVGAALGTHFAAGGAGLAVVSAEREPRGLTRFEGKAVDEQGGEDDEGEENGAADEAVEVVVVGEISGQSG